MKEKKKGVAEKYLESLKLARPKNGFTDAFMKSLKSKAEKNPPAQTIDFRERKGFGVRIRPSGKINFFYIYKIAGERKYMNLGTYDETAIVKAHADYTDAHGKVLKNIDPLAPPLPPPPPKEKKTVQQVAGDFLENWSKINYSPRWHNTVKLALEKDVLSVIGTQEINTIRRSQIISLLETVLARAAGQARNVQKALSKMFWFAEKHREHIDFNPCKELLDNLPALRVGAGRKRVLNDKEIKKAWRRIDRYSGSDSTKRALKFILVTGQRPEEVAGMHRNEIEGDWWTIPWERIKTENSKTLKRPPEDHRVFLTPLALSLIGDSKEFIFPGEEDHIRRNSLSQRVSRGFTLTRKNGKKYHFVCYGLPDWEPHDLRRSVRTGMSRIDIPSDWAEKVLNHKKSKIVTTYDLHKYDEQKQRALTKWALHLETLLCPPCSDSPKSHLPDINDALKFDALKLLR